MTLVVTGSAFPWQKPPSKLLSALFSTLANISLIIFIKTGLHSVTLGWHGTYYAAQLVLVSNLWGSPYFILWTTGKWYHTCLRTHWLTRKTACEFYLAAIIIQTSEVFSSVLKVHSSRSSFKRHKCISAFLRSTWKSVMVFVSIMALLNIAGWPRTHYRAQTNLGADSFASAFLALEWLRLLCLACAVVKLWVGIDLSVITG